MPSGPVKVSFFGRLKLGRVNDPLETSDGVMLVASLDDLLTAKLKATLDRAEAKDYRDIAAMLSAGVSLQKALGAFKAMSGKDPSLPLRAIGLFSRTAICLLCRKRTRPCCGRRGTAFPTSRR